MKQENVTRHEEEGENHVRKREYTGFRHFATAEDRVWPLYGKEFRSREMRRMAVTSLLSVSQLLEQAAKESPEKEAIYDLTRRMTYGQLLEEVEQLASGLLSLGIGKGDRVGVCLPNWHETVQLFFAIAKIGAVLVPFNPKYRLHEARHILQNSGSRIVFVSEEFEQVGFEAIQPLVEKIVTVRFAKPGFLTFSDVFSGAKGGNLPDPAIDPAEDTFCILYTSGTTGSPKGVMITHRGVVISGVEIGRSMHCTSDDVFIIPAPLFHIFGMATNLMSAIYYQSRIVLMEKYRPRDILRLIEQEKVTVHHAVPTMLAQELSLPEFDSYDLSSLRVGMTGASTCPPEVIKAVRERMGMKLCISFGTTETGSVTITGYDDDEEKILDTVGKALNGNEVRIVNDRREPVPTGEIGEIACRGFGTMKGYYKLPEQTLQVLDHEGWYYTGDLGCMDEQGYVRFVGRKKDVIIRGGFNIYPQEIENVLQTHPHVEASAIIGLPDPVLGEIVCAAIRPKPGVKSTEEEIIQFLRPLFASYKLPAKVLFVEEFPVTASGKIQKMKLREEIIKQLG